jgi:hypothetical protein
MWGRKLPRQVDGSEVEVLASIRARENAGGSRPSAPCGGVLVVGPGPRLRDLAQLLEIVEQLRNTSGWNWVDRSVTQKLRY